MPRGVPRLPRGERQQLEHGLLLQVEAVVHHLVRDLRPQHLHARLLLVLHSGRVGLHVIFVLFVLLLVGDKLLVVFSVILARREVRLDLDDRLELDRIWGAIQ